MDSDIHRIGMIVVLDEAVMPNLAQLAIHNHWHILQTPLARKALPDVLRRRAQMLVVQISVPVDEAVELIRLLRTTPRKVPILAVAASHDAELERATREAGATCYLPGCEALGMLQDVVLSMLPQQMPSG
jgi:DNA-binding response OmpR family regulator